MAVVEPAELTSTGAWTAAYPGARIGVLSMTGVRNPDSDEALDELLEGTAARLRLRLGGAGRADLLANDDIKAYAAYYRRFDKTYHVLLQIESVALKDKPLRARGALVAAMFRAEVETGLLTAGHDSDLIKGRITVDVASAGDRYSGLGGREIVAVAGDMCIRDETGIVSSIIHGPDERTRLRPETHNVLFTTYAPAGVCVESLIAHMERIAEGVTAVSPQATASYDVILAK